MSPGLFASLARWWRRRRQRREGEAICWIKARYHVFRVLLANNERALEHMAEVDRLLRENEPSRLAEAVGGLNEVVLELADGLNRLTDNAHAGLYPRLESLSAGLGAALGRHAAAPPRAWLDLEEVTPDMREQTGGKAEPLGALSRAGLPVPPGVCLTRRTCREYLRQTKLEDRLKALAREAARPGAGLEALAAQARAMIAASVPPAGFAAGLGAAWDRLSDGSGASVSVRSSASSEDGAERSFAGQYASVLGVRSREALAEAFKAVLASGFSARAMAYRAGAGLAGESLDMAVLCQRMVDAKASGVIFTREPMDPASGRMLVTAVWGLGTQAVSGRAPADVYRPARAAGERPEDTPAKIAVKATRETVSPQGGLRLEDVPEDERARPALSPQEVALLRGYALRIESLSGCPQDIEWAIDRQGRAWILQSRPARLSRPARPGSRPAPEEPGDAAALLEGGVGASPGRAAGSVHVVRSRQDLDAAALAPRPMVLALHQSMVDAASLVPHAAGILVDMGNPLDHLAALARELGIPMVTGLGSATTALGQGRWVLVDALKGAVLEADPQLWRDAPETPPRKARREPEAASDIRRMILPLNLTDAYGPAFSIMECASLHDMVRYIHEKAVMALFEAGDAVAEQSFSLVRRVEEGPALHFMVIDLGGGLMPGGGRVARREEILCEPLAALCRGMATPGLHWGRHGAASSVSGLATRALLDPGSGRPVGNPNYALVSRDYVNLNARVDYHFAMVDAVCGANPRENSVRFRFKGGGAGRVQRERRAEFAQMVMNAEEFYTTRQGDMVTAVLMEGARETVRAKMEMLGRFLGFSRLLDAAMTDDGMPARLARAFLDGDYGLQGLGKEEPGRS